MLRDSSGFVLTGQTFSLLSWPAAASALLFVMSLTTGEYQCLLKITSHIFSIHSMEKNFWRLKEISLKAPTTVPRSHGQQCPGKPSTLQKRLRFKILLVPGPILASPNSCPGMRTLRHTLLVWIQRKKELLL